MTGGALIAAGREKADRWAQIGEGAERTYWGAQARVGGKRFDRGGSDCGRREEG